MPLLPHIPGRQRRQWLLGVAGWCLAAGAAQASDPPALVIRGRLRRPNAGTVARFDLDALMQLPQTSFTTHTPWYASARRFTGPLLRDVLARVGAEGSTLRMTALNDYRVDVPMQDAQRHDVILALLLDGAPMAVRDKGPLFMIYPFDAQPELRSAVYYSRSVWQLSEIEVL
ncbi:MAG: molybdopterin-dependent oxidoreductase [Rubrivivax sp.]|nr:molybdopterin-dependent oxidoreductase [Rubrivivax sp.]MDH5338437.1 molybdopterin-dependent oxidoreductase [Rubrivivax sp.]